MFINYGNLNFASSFKSITTMANEIQTPEESAAAYNHFIGEFCDNLSKGNYTWPELKPNLKEFLGLSPIDQVRYYYSRVHRSKWYDLPFGLERLQTAVKHCSPLAVSYDKKMVEAYYNIIEADEKRMEELDKAFSGAQSYGVTVLAQSPNR